MREEIYLTIFSFDKDSSILLIDSAGSRKRLFHAIAYSLHTSKLTRNRSSTWLGKPQCACAYASLVPRCALACKTRSRSSQYRTDTLRCVTWIYPTIDSFDARNITTKRKKKNKKREKYEQPNGETAGALLSISDYPFSRGKFHKVFE